jgi:putative drug exporter of the RND superfamily
MAELLYRLGRFAGRRPWLVITCWLVVLAAAVAGFVVGRGPLAPGFDIPGTETARVTRVLDEKLPQLSGGAGMVVFRTTNGAPINERQREAISQLTADAAALPYVATVVDPFASEEERRERAQAIADGPAQLDAAEAQLPPGPQGEAMRQLLQEQRRQLELGSRLLALAEDIRLISDDGSTAMASVTFTVSRLMLPDSAKIATRDHFLGADIDGISIDVSDEIAQTLPSVVSPGELAGVVVAALVLIIMLGTLVAAALPILTASLGLGVGVLATLSLSSVVQMASVTPVLGVMLGLAVGIDYALFIVNRHRRQLTRGMSLPESLGLANGTAGNAVVFAGSTVLAALLGLNITGIPFLGVMGNVGAACVAVAVLMAVTLTPALLGLAGQRVVSRRLRRALATGKAVPPAKPMSHLGAVLGVLVGAAALVAVAVPAQSMRLGLPDGSSQAQDSTPYHAYRSIAAEFGEGMNGPLLVTATLAEPATDPTALLETQVRIATMLAAQPDVVGVAPVAASDDGTLLAFQVVPEQGPTSVSTEALVRSLRGLSPLADGTELGVAGQATGNIDISESLRAILPTYLGLVIGLSALIMLVVFRSILIPLVATVGFVLSLLATFGALVAVYQWGWLGQVFGVHDPGPLLNFLPIMLVGILFGLAMDYQLFLASGMREAYVHGTPARAAVVAGRRAGRSVVTAAGIIMIAVFAGFIFSEVVTVRPLGFGLAFGVLADAFVVRMLVVPAVLHLLGAAAWWLPRWLSRLLPNVDVEGAALQRRHEPATPSPKIRDLGKIPSQGDSLSKIADH